MYITHHLYRSSHRKYLSMRLIGITCNYPARRFCLSSENFCDLTLLLLIPTNMLIVETLPISWIYVFYAIRKTERKLFTYLGRACMSKPHTSMYNGTKTLYVRTSVRTFRICAYAPSIQLLLHMRIQDSKLNYITLSGDS